MTRDQAQLLVGNGWRRIRIRTGGEEWVGWVRKEAVDEVLTGRKPASWLRQMAVDTEEALRRGG